jgi:hypothetical protein
MSAEKVDPIEHMQRGIRKLRKVLVVLGAILSVGAAAALVGALVSDDGSGSQGDRTAGLGLIGFFLLVGLVCFVAGLRSTPERDRVFVTLRDRPDGVVWIYEKDTTVNGSTFHKVVVATDAGLEKEIDVKTLEAQVAMRQALSARCPSAVRGYTSERQLAFKKNPRAVLNA